jgi:benzoyl-CoA reductase subunit B
MNKIIKYDTRPLDCWPKMKELRRARFRQTWEAHQKGELVIIGSVEWFLSLCAGMGNYVNPSYGPYTTGLLRDISELNKTLDKVDNEGYGHDICAPMRCNLGQLLLGMIDWDPMGRPFKPDLVFQPNICFNMAKMGQIYSKYYNIPLFILDLPHLDTPHNRSYLFTQMQEAIVWMEKTTGRKYDDEKLIEALKNEWDCMVLWARICLLNQAVPAPLNFRQLWSLRLPLRTFRHRKETLDFYKILHDEVKQRVKNGISAQGYETVRLLQESLPPFYDHDLLKLGDKYGAVFVGGELPFTTIAAWEIKSDRTWVSPPLLAESGRQLKTRDDALWALVNLNITYTPPVTWVGYGDRILDYIKRVKDWHAQGAVVNLDPSCRVACAGTEEAILALKKAGIPVCVYECEESDPRTCNRNEIERKLEMYYTEVLGLSPIENYPGIDRLERQEE